MRTRFGGKDVSATRRRDWHGYYLPGSDVDPLDRFWTKVDRRGPDDCWPWLARLNDQGYGTSFSMGADYGGKTFRAHRAAYTLLVGPIPKGYQLDHTCHHADLTCPGGVECAHRRCVNPAHLEVVTCKENLARMHKLGRGRNSRKTHCQNGHPFGGVNTRIALDGSRVCRICRRAWEREWVRLRREGRAS